MSDSEWKLIEEMEREEARLLNECPRPKNATDGACGVPSCLFCWPALALREGRVALEAALARESHLRGIIGGLNPGLDIDAALAAVPVETQEACPFCKGHGDIWTSWSGDHPVTCGHCHGTGKRPVETREAAAPDDYARPGWRMFPVL